VTIEGKGHSRRLAGAVFLALALTGAICVFAFAAPGALDPTFSGDGKLTTNFTRGDDGASGVAIQADGKIVVAGQAGGYPRRTRFALARYRAGGTLDPTFGGDGKVTMRFVGSAYASDVAIQADGKIVVVGQTNDKFALARYNRNGTLDSTFNGDGKATTTFLPLDVASATSVAVQSDGKSLSPARRGVKKPQGPAQRRRSRATSPSLALTRMGPSMRASARTAGSRPTSRATTTARQSPSRPTGGLSLPVG
jgi:uncharacterized delta-60 repeat protein